MTERPFVRAARVLLRPYSAALVPVYHAWLADAWLREMTASERLSLEEERAAQREWARDPAKQTFIVFDRAVAEGRAGIGPAGGANGGAGAAGAGLPVAEAEAAAAAAATSASEPPPPREALGACGDVNIFMMDADAAADYAPPDAAVDVAAAAEIMVMIAEPAFRRRGLAAEAVRAMMAFAFRTRGVRRFVAKISDANAASLRLFAKLGFRVARAMPHFEETHMTLDLSEAEGEALCAAAAEEIALAEPGAKE
jgi:RimJ/RimL family protein N-acetyltransferase